MSGYMTDIIRLSDWNMVSEYTDTNMNIKPSYLERIAQGNYPNDAFSKGQLASKAWLLSQLNYQVTLPLPLDSVVAILGCWIGSIVEPLLDQMFASRIYGIDIDPSAIDLAERFNQHLVQDNWRFKGVVADAAALNSSNMEFETGGELISVKPNVIINTSCEHMDTHWFETADSDQLIVMQTNNSKNYTGHINTCADAREMKAKYPLRNILYCGELHTPAYNRIMQIGYK